MAKKAEKIYLVFHSTQLTQIERLHEIANDWLSLNQIIEPQGLHIITENQAVSSVDDLKAQIKTITPKVQWSSRVEGSCLESEIDVVNQQVMLAITMEWSIFHTHQHVIEDFVNQEMTRDGLFAYIRSYQEFLAHNTFNLLAYQKEIAKDISQVRLMKSDQEEVIVDCSQFSGFDLMFKGLCLTSCWKMWFSDNYYSLIPKQAFLEVQQVDNVYQLSADVIQITLYDSPLNWQLPANLHFQELFKVQLGFEQIEWINGVGSLSEPYAEFIPAADRIQMIQYQNDYMQPTNKTDSSHFISRIYNYKQNIYIESRQMGKLNYQAYFPFEVIQSKEHLAYWVLNTEYALDQGVESFKFYIDFYLKAQSKLKDFAKQATVLMIYLPEKAFSELPLKELESCLIKQNYKVLRSVVDSQFIVIKSGESLSVEFKRASLLEKDVKKWQFPDTSPASPREEVKSKWLDLLDKIRFKE